jgi:hypothetical protein
METAYQFMTAFAQNPAQEKKLYRRAVGLCLALLGQFIPDEDDEARLATTTTPEEERDLLVEILNSPRQNVLPDLLERLLSHGSDLLPELVAALQQEEFFWPRLRALDTITQLAQLYPGGADPAIPDILDQIREDESDYILEAAERALVAIGPAVVEPAVKRMDYEDFTTYDIYILGTLGEIPTEASVQALLDYHEHANADEFTIEILSYLAHPRTLPLLKSYYQDDPDPTLAEFCYKVAYLNRIDDPFLTQWKAEALEDRARQQKLIENLEEEWTSYQAPKKEKPDQQPWASNFARTIVSAQDELKVRKEELKGQDHIDATLQKEIARRAKAKEKGKRKQEKKSRKRNRKRR